MYSFEGDASNNELTIYEGDVLTVTNPVRCFVFLLFSFNDCQNGAFFLKRDSKRLFFFCRILETDGGKELMRRVPKDCSLRRMLR